MRVPARSVRPSLSRSASLRPIIAPGPGLHRLGSPEPKLHTMCLFPSISMTRLLNWSEMSTLPGLLKSLCADARAVGASNAKKEMAKQAKKNIEVITIFKKLNRYLMNSIGYPLKRINNDGADTLCTKSLYARRLHLPEKIKRNERRKHC